MKIAVIDDEEKWRSEIGFYLKKYGCPEYDTYEGGCTLLASGKQYDILFLDVELENENGFVVAEEYGRLYSKTLIVFVTSHAELSRQGYRINAFRYVDKYFLCEIDEALTSAKRRLLDRKKLTVDIVGVGETAIPCADIYYVEADRHHVRICTVSGDQECREGIAKITERFASEGFYLIHRAYLVNMRYVQEICPQGVIMKNGDNLCLSRRKYTEFRKEYVKWNLLRGFG
jgi:DNA-binding LytR/AlgR family response regulator